MLCALTATACTDTLDEAALPKPLSVDVNARNITARAPIHGTALPDASSIGISLLAEDGTPYDGVTYANLKYTASGTAPDQTWSTPDIPTLSSTSAKLVAYYPWADGTDYNAVPVETDTQTDYMYSKWLTGLSNANPNASIVMQHALTAVRVALVKGDFTADVDVSSVSVKSPAFATAGSLDATTGVLSGLSGTGEAVTVTADFPLTAQATNVEVMAVPDVSVAAGVTTVTTQIGDRKYSVNINFTESYKQGYIYTYTLTLNNTGMEVTSVAVTPWQDGSETEGELAVTYNDNEYVVKIAPTADSYTFTHNLVDFVGTVNWGDGTTSEYTTATSYPTHTYATADEYTVVAAGMATGIRTYTNNLGWDPTNKFYVSDWTMNASPIITDIIHIGAEMGITDMTGAFTGQQNITMLRDGIFDGLTEVESFDFLFAALTFKDEYKMNIDNIPNGLFNKCVKAKSFTMAFYSNHSIITIPENIFDGCTLVETFNETFSGCKGLTMVPAGLFDNNTEVKSFHGTFMGTAALKTVPEELFDNNVKVTDFGRVFGCSGLTEIPVGLFDNNPEAINFEIAFSKCYDLTAIPAGLFDYNTKAKWFDMAFAYCSKLTSIPEGLFDKCTEVTSCAYTFEGCTGITEIPTGLFDNCTEMKSFWGTFQGCTGITEIPEGLFDNNTKVTIFRQTFRGCTGITEIPEGLFDNCTEVTKFAYTFEGCTGITEIPAGLFDKCTEVTAFEGVFNGCAALTSIPAGLFDNCTEVTSFSYTFSECTGITEIPEGLFDYNTKVTNFSSTFYECTALTGESPYTTINIDGNDVKVHLYERSSYPEYFTAPKYCWGMFYNCTGLTDYANIPASWK